MSSMTLSGGAISEEEAAAALAAVACLLEEEAAAAAGAPAAGPPPGWQQAARLMTQGLLPTRVPAPPSWGRIERLRRGVRPGTGVTGQ